MKTKVPNTERPTVDQREFTPFATQWLLELGLLDNPHIKEALMLNIFKVSPSIKDVQLLIDMNESKMLVFTKLTFWARMFHKREICSDVLDMLTAALPSYTFRVTLDSELFNKAVDGFIKASSKNFLPKKTTAENL